MAERVRVTITYCQPCRFAARASWFAQELLTSLGDYVEELRLIPGSGGVFDVDIDGERVFTKKDAGRYPEPLEIKELMRQRLDAPPARAHERSGSGA